MGYQNTKIETNEMQKKILDLEKKYFLLIKKALESESFLDDLVFVEKEIRSKYSKFKSTWKLKNKFKVPAERIVRHYVYTQMNPYIHKIYPSPISSDIGFQVKSAPGDTKAEAILCIDIKTVDTKSNTSDVKTTQVEPNQCSFNNKNHKPIKAISNLEKIDDHYGLPVLTYVVKFVYTDDGYSFVLNRDSKLPSLTLSCIPNGELSDLFDYDIVQSFKTYNYYDDKEYSPIEVKKYTSKNELNKRKKYVEECCVKERGFTKTTVVTGLNSTSIAYVDTANMVLWWLTSDKKVHKIRAIKSGATMRLNNDILKKRFDSEDKQWDGYVEIPIKEALN